MALTSQQQAIQNQIDGYDSNTSTQVLLSTLLRAIDAGDIRQGYADSAAFPTNDSDFIGFIGYDEYDSSLRYIGRDLDIHKIDSASAPAGNNVYTYQGEISGYRSGGNEPGYSVTIDKFSFTSDGDATDVGDLTVGRRGAAGSSSSTHGYTSAGLAAGPGGPPEHSNVIDKFPFSADANATDVGDVVVGLDGPGGQSSETHGYVSGGYGNPSTQNSDAISKFSFTIDGNTTDVGDLTQGRFTSGASSATHGYTMGGNPPTTNIIDKFPFAADENATDVGDLTVARYYLTGNSSSTHGYTSGGAPDALTIDKFTFATDANATDVGDLIGNTPWAGPTGQSSTTHGYVTGNAGPTYTRAIQKYSFTTDGNATDVGDLTSPTSPGLTGAAGQQV